MALIAVNPDAVLTPVFNERFGTWCVAVAVFAFTAWLASTQNSAEREGAWQTIGIGAALAVNALILVAVSLEIHSFWWMRNWHGQWRDYEVHRMYAQFSYSAWFMLFGAILLASGFARRSAFLRWQALVLLAFSVGKVFLVDMSALSQGYRILSFLGLGALLLAVSFVYQRDWLNLRGAKQIQNPEGPGA
jgi:uncharacterized membrane protein